MFSFVKGILRLLGVLLRARKYDDFDLTRAAGELSYEGITMRAYGIVIPSEDDPVGVYVVRYVPSIKENKYGRYN